MTCTESYGGECPNCGYTKIFLRYGSDGIFQFDACPKCGFAFGTNGYDPPREGKEFWKSSSLLKMFDSELRKRHFPLTRKGLYLLTLSWSEDNADVGTVFKYTKTDVKRIMGIGKEIVQFT